MTLCGGYKIKVDVTPISHEFIEKMKEIFPDFIETLKNRIEKNSIYTKTCYADDKNQYETLINNKVVHITKSMNGKYIHIDYSCHKSISEAIYIHKKYTIESMKEYNLDHIKL